MSIEVVSMQEAQNSLPQLLKRVAAGETIFIASEGRVEASLAPPVAKPKRQLGGMEGKLIIPDDFDAPLPPDIVAAFYGEGGTELF